MRADVCIKTLSVRPSQTLTEMETPRLALIALICVLLISQTRVNGEEVELKVKPGENITLYCDRSLTIGSLIAWIRNCFHEYQPSLIIDMKEWKLEEAFQNFIFTHNSSSNSFDLYITNISVSDLGLYYCAEVKNELIENQKGHSRSTKVYYNGNRTTRLTLVETSCSEPSSPPDCVFCWMLLFGVCLVCVLLFSICVYCLCQKKSTGSAPDQKDRLKNRNIVKESEDTEVCYASLDVKTRRKIRHKKTREKSSDFSIYSQVRTET